MTISEEKAEELVELRHKIGVDDDYTDEQIKNNILSRKSKGEKNE